VKAMVAATKDRFERLDYAFNNAGISGTAAPVHAMPLEVCCLHATVCTVSGPHRRMLAWQAVNAMPASKTQKAAATAAAAAAADQ
jgi:NAD(P)-dependent dehydrogenase (short-subunit alcohol dehydrogenase family)